MQTDIKILVRLHHSLVLRGFFVGNASTFRFHWEFSSVPCVSVRGSQFSSSPKVVRLTASCGGSGRKKKNRFPSTPRYLFVFVTTLSDTKAGLVRSSCRQSRRPGRLSLHLHLNLPFIRLNQWKELIRDGTSRLTYIGEVRMACGTRLWESNMTWPLSETHRSTN